MLKRLIIEAHRRSLWQVLTIYIVASWGALQVAEAITDSAGLPEWVPGFALVLLIIGFPIVMATAFVQEGIPGITPALSGGDDAGGASPTPAISESANASAANLARGTGSLDLRSTRPAKHHRLLTWRNAIIGGVAAFALLGLLAAGYMAMRTLGIGAPGTLLAQGLIEEGAPVLLAEFESSGEAELGEVVAKTLRIDLMQSPTIRVLDRADVRDALSRMQLSDGAPITPGIATQLAEREGYAAVIAGDVASAGTGYVLTANILGGAGFRPLAGFRETARNDGELVDAIERLSRSIRDKVGESLRSVRSGPSLEQVTTASLPALRAYTRGVRLEQTGDLGAALEQYERAVALDSTFAMSHRKVAGVLLNLRIRRADVRLAARRAYELRDRLPELERHLTTGLFHETVSGDVDAAVRGYEQALLIDSTNASVRNSLANLYTFKGRYADAARLYAAPLRDRPIAALWGNLARARFRMGDYDGAVATLDSARAALPDWAVGYHLQAQFAAARGDYRAADSLVSLLESRARTPLEREYARWDRYLLAALRGKLAEAERLRTAPGAELFLADSVPLAADRALLRLERGDTAGAIRLAADAATQQRDGGVSDDVPMLINVLAEAGAVVHAGDLLASWESAAPVNELGMNIRQERDYSVGVVARARRQFDTALSTLEAIRRRCASCGAYIAYALARTYEDMGQAERAIAEYERSLAHPDPDRLAFQSEIPQTLRRLGELYDARGDTQKAATYYAKFIELWKDADPELQPQVRAAQARVSALLPDRR